MYLNQEIISFKLLKIIENPLHINSKLLFLPTKFNKNNYERAYKTHAKH